MTTLNPSLDLQKILSQSNQSTLNRFKQVTKQYALFHIAFCTLGFLELIAFTLFFSFFTQTSLFAFSLAGLFVTTFTYFIFLFYLQAKKPQELSQIVYHFAATCHSLVAEDIHSSPLTIHSLQQLLTSLHGQEYAFYAIPSSFQTLSPLMQKFSAWVHWKNLYKIKELILTQLIHEHVQLIKEHPTHEPYHLSLAETYILLSEIYTDPRRLDPKTSYPWVSPEYSSSSFIEKRKRALFKAREEYKILLFYSPHAPAIHRELAKVYYDLDELQRAIESYEVIVRDDPEDLNSLFYLGTLYFETSLFAQGLQVYEQLKIEKDPRAEELMAYYS